MKEKKLYYRRKGKSLIIEGKEDGKSVLIWTLPNPEILLEGILRKASFFTQGKQLKIMEKLNRLKLDRVKSSQSSQDLPIININRNPEKDAGMPTPEEIEKSLSEIGNI